MRRPPGRPVSDARRAGMPLAGITTMGAGPLVVGGALAVIRPEATALAVAVWASGFAVFSVGAHRLAWTRAPRSPRRAGHLSGTAFACLALTFWAVWPAAARWAQDQAVMRPATTSSSRAAVVVPGLLITVMVLGVLVAASVPLASWLRRKDAEAGPRPLLTPRRFADAVDMADQPTIGKTKTTTSRIIMPGDTNPQGNAYGGSIVKYLDEIAAVVARRHARTNVVTASIERMDFLAPVYLGDLLIFRCALIYTGRTSMIVGTRIEAEDMASGRVVKTGSCYLTFVALDRDGKPATVDKIVPGDDPEEQRWYEKGKIIRDHSKSVMRQLKEHGSPVEP